jgi:cytochrome c oxidase assembly protein subunit 11
VTGLGGTTQRAAAAPDTILDRTITVRFDANVARGLDWSFEPVQRTLDVRIGENALAFYRATNRSDKPLKGTAAFNVAPDTAGLYFAKIECFCFKEQLLQPGQTVEMPVSFFVDPSLVKDPDATRIKEITLSYTFYEIKDAPAKVGALAPIETQPAARADERKG